MAKLKIGIIGAGAIGSKLAQFICKDLKDKAKLTGIYDIDREKVNKLSTKLKRKSLFLNLSVLIKNSSLLIEAASAKVSAGIAKKAINAGCDIMVMSIGGLLGEEGLFRLAERKNKRIYLPSGAVCGIDGLKAASQVKIKRVNLTTRKPPGGLEEAPYIIEKDINLKKIKKETVIFSGTAKQAVKAFPKNINVSALLSIAGIGAKKTHVKIVTSPKFRRNSHEVEVIGDFGRLITKTENIPSPDNPKTSFLAVLSACAALRQILSNTKVGT